MDHWRRAYQAAGEPDPKEKLFAEGAYSNGSKATVYPANANGKVQWKKGKSIHLPKELDKA